MQKMYDEYKDVAEFRMIYIREAHAADGTWPVGYAKEKGITEHKDYGQRCETAERLLNDENLTIPCIIDGMDNAVNEAYSAWPDRVFLVRTDGRLAVAADRGPWGFKPGVDAAKAWLAEYKATGVEPPLPGEEPMALVPKTPVLEEGKPFPDLRLPALDDGRPLSIETFRGKRIVLHVFASW